MRTIARLSLLLSPLLIAACAATAPPATEFPAGARAPSASELAGLLRGKSFNMSTANGGTIRTDYAGESNGITVFLSGRSDSGSWRTEDGRVCFQFKVLPSACNDVRLVGADLYLKRSNGEVARAAPVR